MGPVIETDGAHPALVREGRVCRGRGFPVYIVGLGNVKTGVNDPRVSVRVPWQLETTPNKYLNVVKAYVVVLYIREWKLEDFERVECSFHAVEVLSNISLT